MKPTISLVAFAVALAIVPLIAAATVSVQLVDKTPRKNVYDGFELTDNKTKIKIPKGKPEWTFSLGDFDNNKFTKLKGMLGDAAYQKILKTQRYTLPKNEFQSISGIDKFGVYYFTRPDKQKDTVILILVSYGEYQPARYIAHVEGIWRVKGAKF